VAPVIYCTISGFPNSSKYRFAGLDASAQAITGMAYTNCASKQQPMKVGFPVLDQVTGILAANQILANLLYLRRGDESTNELNIIHISVSLIGTAIWLQVGQVIKALGGEEYFRTGNEDQFAAPFSYYTASDGLISIATVNEAQFSKFCSHVLGDPDFQKKFTTIRYRIDNQAQFESELNEKLKMKSRLYWSEKCAKHGIPSAPVLTVSESIENDFVKNELISTKKGGAVIVSAGITNSIFRQMEYSSAPMLGQDKDKIKSAVIDQTPRSRL
jgi:crotonobetainyl-CoA:carnitine CoA-transferase CaiB-like acyl-CoA transferase